MRLLLHERPALKSFLAETSSLVVCSLRTILRTNMREENNFFVRKVRGLILFQIQSRMNISTEIGPVLVSTEIGSM